MSNSSPCTGVQEALWNRFVIVVVFKSNGQNGVSKSRTTLIEFIIKVKEDSSPIPKKRMILFLLIAFFFFLCDIITFIIKIQEDSKDSVFE